LVLPLPDAVPTIKQTGSEARLTAVPSPRTEQGLSVGFVPLQMSDEQRGCAVGRAWSGRAVWRKHRLRCHLFLSI